MSNKKRRQKGSHGAVTVFLSIVLVPCIIFASIFTDLSRVQLSQATTASAGDLAMYSLLSRYDEKLKEYYGIVASCQDIDDFFKITENYFTGMLQAEGVSGEGSQLFIDYLNNLKEGGDYSDLLRVEISDLKVDNADNNVLGKNPALIEDGIVEFMKYRGPIQIATNIIDRFSELNLGDTVSEVDKDKEVSDAKQVYAEKQGELLEKAFYTHLAIREYEKAQATPQTYHAKINKKDNIPSFSSYNDLAERLEAIRIDLREVTRLVIQYYYPGTENIDDRKLPVFKESKYRARDSEFTYSVSDGEGGYIEYLRYSSLKKAMGGGSDLGTARDNAERKREELREKCDEVYEACKDISKPLAIGGNSDVNEVYYTLTMQETTDAECDLAGIESLGDDLMERRGLLKAILSSSLSLSPEDEADAGSDWRDMAESVLDIYDSVYDDYLEEDSSSGSDYHKMAYDYNSVGPAVKVKVSNRTYPMNSTFMQKVQGSANSDISTFAEVVNSYLSLLYKLLEKQQERLTIAIDGGEVRDGKNAIPLDELVKLAGEFQTTRNDWGSAANRYSTEYAESEQKLYNAASTTSTSGIAEGSDANQKEEMEGERIAAQINGESVQELKDRLNNIRIDIEVALQSLDFFRYGGTLVRDMGGREGMITAARTVVPKNDTHSLSAAESAAGGYYNSLVSPLSGEIYTAPAQKNEANGNNPVLDTATPKLYKFLKEQLKDEGKVEDELDANKKRNEEYQKQADEAKDKAGKVDPEMVENKGENLERIHEGYSFSPLAALGSIVSIVENVFNGTGDELRDQLYVCEYIMSMFTYSTLDNEGKYHLMIDNGHKDVTYKDFPYNEVKDLWEAQVKNEVMRNQSLTNRPLTKDYNLANLGEVEYILFGNKEIDENLKAAYNNIFAIRMMLNLVSGFCNFYSGTEGTAGVIGATAGAIQAATMGIVPIPLTKCVIIGVLSTLETAKDLERLKKGGRVEIYKSKEENWVCSLAGVEKGVKDLASNLENTQKSESKGEEESGMYYSDYLRIFLLLSLTNDKSVDSETKLPSYATMLLRVGDLIQANIRKAPDGNASFDIDKARCYFNLTATVRVKPLMISLPIVLNYEPDAQNLISATDWCTYKINVTRGYS